MEQLQEKGHFYEEETLNMLATGPKFEKLSTTDTAL